MVGVSVVGQQKWERIWRGSSRGLSVAVFVTGTVIFASVTLLSLIMAVVVLTLTLVAGIFGRGVASWIVTNVATTDPIIHIISSTREEAYKAIAEILTLKSVNGSPYQVEINGHILIDQRSIATRSPFMVSWLGVLAEPYDIAIPFRMSTISDGVGNSLNPLSPQLTNTSRGGVLTPFLSSATDPSLPTHRAANEVVTSISQQSFRSMTLNNNTDSSSA